MTRGRNDSLPRLAELGAEGKGEMSDEEESIDPITTAERGILQLLARREASHAFAFDEGAEEDPEMSAVNQLAQHPAPAIPVKQKKTAGGNDPTTTSARSRAARSAVSR
jgi:hypothetical protein